MRFAAVLLGSILLAAPAAAERGTSAERAACTPDVFRLCMSQIPDVDQIVACLKKEKAHLSNGCRRVIAGDDRHVASVTRSIRADSDWCLFGREPAATDEVWRSWCKDRARVD
jgi:hypothetical protein